MNEVVKYDNYMNDLRLKSFTSTDLDMLMTLCSKMRDKDIEKLTLSFQELREKMNYKQTSKEVFIQDLKRMNKKLMDVTCTLETKKEVLMFVLFPTFRINKEDQTLTVSVNQDFKFVLNELMQGFTRFELTEFVQLTSKYSKTLYRLLKQFKSTGMYVVTIDDFRELMDCPKTYSNKHVMERLIKPTIEELQKYFKNLKCDPQVAKKRGNPITGYLFTFEKDVIESTKTHPKKQTKRENKFNNFDQRTYDYEKLEQDLLRSGSENINGQLDIFDYPESIPLSWQKEKEEQ